ncbi:hypothetical protein [Paraburkholderia tropica]|uniref:hypothetical protein n=1 Tax=Paraburkholderia tropica TaxID=92647 RepID=UPI001CC511AA|nr:hypothetical protein [Paraburkholderia tropica]
MLVPDFAALRYFFYYRFPDVILRLNRAYKKIDAVQHKKSRARKCLRCARRIADSIRDACFALWRHERCSAAKYAANQEANQDAKMRRIVNAKGNANARFRVDRTTMEARSLRAMQG